MIETSNADYDEQKTEQRRLEDASDAFCFMWLGVACAVIVMIAVASVAYRLFLAGL